MKLTDRAQAEVRELHRFFEDWYRGTVPTDGFGRLETVLGDGFTLRSPNGQMLSRQDVLDDVRAAHGARAMSIRIENSRLVTDDPVTVEYEEWQVVDGVERGRASIAVFSAVEGTPHGLVWMSVVETKLARWD